MRRIFALLALTLGTAASAGGSAETDAAVRAQEWLQLVDSARYEQAWAQASASLRSRGTRERWAQDVRAARRNDGAASCRKLVTLERRDDPPRLIALFVTEFGDGRRIGEKVTLTAATTQIDDYRVGPAAVDHGPPCSTASTPEALK